MPAVFLPGQPAAVGVRVQFLVTVGGGDSQIIDDVRVSNGHGIDYGNMKD